MGKGTEKIVSYALIAAICIVAFIVIGNYTSRKARIERVNNAYIKLNNASSKAIKAGKFEEAKTYAEEAIVLIPTEIGGHINLASVYIAEGDYEKAYQHSVEVLKKGLVLEVAKNLVVLCDKTGRNNEIPKWEKIVERIKYMEVARR